MTKKSRVTEAALERKSFTFKFTKEIDEAGRFEGYAAVFGNLDSHKDIIHPGAFKKTLQENPDVPILWQHDPYEPIGVSVEMKEDKKGLFVTGQLTHGVQRADEARLLMQAGAIKGLSIGYRTIKPTYTNGVRHLREIALKEWSPVTFYSNELAIVTDVKGSFMAVKAEGDVIWDPEAGFSDLRDDIRALLTPAGTSSSYWVQDISLDLTRAIIQDYDADKTWVVPITVDDDGEPQIGPPSEWIEAEQAWVQAADASLAKNLLIDIEFKEGRTLSDASRKLVEQAHEALQALLDASQPPKSTDDAGAAVKAATTALLESARRPAA